MEGIKRLLTTQQMEYIYDKALETLEKVGLQCDHKPTVEALAQRVPLAQRGGRLHLDRESLADYFAQRKLELAAAEEDAPPFTTGGHWNSAMLCDPLTNRPRPASEEEAVAMARLSDALGSVRVPLPVSPGGINPRLNTLVCEKLALQNTRNLGCCLTATEDYEVETIVEMYKAAGRRYVMAVEPLISPLRLNADNMEVYFRYKDREDFDITIFPTIPMAGASTPLAMPAGLVHALAESLALDYIFAAISDSRHKSFTLRLEPFDMRHSNIAFGTPEWTLLKQALNELWTHLMGKTPRSGTFRTTSRTVDGQALIQASCSFLWQAAQGARRFGAMGQMAVDEVWSPVMAVLEGELLRYGDRLQRGFEGCWDDTDPVEVIAEGVKDNGFFMVDSTLEVLRTMYDAGGIFSNENLNSWLNGDRTDAAQRAWEKARAMIDAHDFALDGAATRDIDRLYQKAAQRYQ